MLAPLHETPLAIVTFVNIVVAHRDYVPAIAVFMLSPAIDRTCRVIRVDEVELVTANQVDAAVEPPEHHVVPALQRLSATALPARVDALDEERNEGVQIAGVQRHRVSAGQ